MHLGHVANEVFLGNTNDMPCGIARHYFGLRNIRLQGSVIGYRRYVQTTRERNKKAILAPVISKVITNNAVKYVLRFFTNLDLLRNKKL